MGGHQRGNSIVDLLLSLELATVKNNSIHYRRCHPHAIKSASKAALTAVVECSSPSMRLAQHLTLAARLVQAMSAWLVKTRRAPPRHCSDARVYDHTTTTATHDKEYNPPPPPPCRGLKKTRKGCLFFIFRIPLVYYSFIFCVSYCTQ